MTDKELLSLRNFIEYYRQYLLGGRFTVRTDHRVLSFLFSFEEPRGRLARYLEILSAYDFTVVYRKGMGHGNADGMSRCVTPWKYQCNEVDTTESLKCWPCKKCETRAVDMKSSLLMGCLDKGKEVRYQPTKGGEAQDGVDQMLCVTETVDPNNNGCNSEFGKLTFVSGTPCGDGHVNVESGFELDTMPQIQSRGNCDDS